MDGRLGIVPVVLHPSTLHSISPVQVKLPADHRNCQKTVEIMYFEILKRFGGGLNVPVMHPVADMEIKSKTLEELLKAKKAILTQLEATEIQKLTPSQEAQYHRKTELKDTIKQLEQSIRKSSQMIMSQELVSMKRVMRRLDLADKNDVPSLKGKVAAHISATDEILITEMLFSGMFNDMEEPAHIAAVLSCLVFTEHKKQEDKD